MGVNLIISEWLYFLFIGRRRRWIAFFILNVYLLHRGHSFLLAVSFFMFVLNAIYPDVIENWLTALRIRVMESVQCELDKEARKCVDDLLKAPPVKRKPIVFFLRPFSGDVTLCAKNRSTVNGLDIFPLETRLVLGYVGANTTVSLRGPKPSLHSEAWCTVLETIPPGTEGFEKHAGRLFYIRPGEVQAKDTDWFASFSLLAQASDWFVSIPIDTYPQSQNGPVVEELIHLLNSGRGDRCIFVMPPEQGIRLSHGGYAKVSELWENTRRKLASHITLPDFRDTLEDGAILFAYYKNEPKCIEVRCKDLSNAYRYCDALCREIQHRVL